MHSKHFTYLHSPTSGTCHGWARHSYLLARAWAAAFSARPAAGTSHAVALSPSPVSPTPGCQVMNDSGGLESSGDRTDWMAGDLASVEQTTSETVLWSL